MASNEDLGQSAEYLNREFNTLTDSSRDLWETFDNLTKQINVALGKTTDDTVRVTNKRVKAEDDVITHLEKTKRYKEKELEELKKQSDFVIQNGRIVKNQNKQQKDATDIAIDRQQKLNAIMGENIVTSAKNITTLEGAIDTVSESLTPLIGNSVGAKAAFESLTIVAKGLVAAFDAAYRANVQYTKSIIEGQRGQQLIAQKEEAIGKSQTEIINKLGGLAIGIGATTAAFFIARTALLAMAGPVGWVTLAIGGAATAAGALGVAAGFAAKKVAETADTAMEFNTQLAGLLDKVFEGFNELGKSSLANSRGMRGLIDDMGILRMSMSDINTYARLLKDNTKTLAMLGGNVIDGMQSMLLTASNLINSGIGNELRLMGITNAEQAEHVAKFLNQQVLLGRQVSNDYVKQSQAAAKYIKELDLLAFYTGQSREEVEKSREAALAVDEFMLALEEANRSGDKQRQAELKSMLELYSSLPKELQATIGKDILLAGAAGGAGPEAAKLYTTMPKVMQMLTEGKSSPMEMQKMMAEELKINRDAYGSAAKYGAKAFEDIMYLNIVEQQKLGAMASKRDESVQQYMREFGVSEREALEQIAEKKRKAQDEETRKANEVIQQQSLEAVRKQEMMSKHFLTSSFVFRSGVDLFSKYAQKLLGEKPDATKEEKDETIAAKKAELKMAVDEKKVIQEKMEENKKTQMQILNEIQEKEKEIKTLEKQGKEWSKREAEIELEKLRIKKANLEDLDKQYDSNIKKLETTATKIQEVIGALKSPPIPPLEPPTPTGSTKMPSRAEMTKAASRVAAYAEAKSGRIGKEEARSVLDYGSERDIREFGGKERLRKIAEYETAIDNNNLDKIFIFGSGSGSKSNFDELRDGLKTRVIAAASEYNSLTGNKIQINSAMRSIEDQQRLWDESEKAGRPGKTATGMPIADPRRGPSTHNMGQAIDIQNYTDPKVVEIFNKHGLFQTVKNDPVHFTLPGAKYGGVFTGPESGYPVELHGREIVLPEKNLTDISNVLSSVKKTELSDLPQISSSSETMIKSFMDQQSSLIEVISSKLDGVINKLSISNDLQQDILNYQQT